MTESSTDVELAHKRSIYHRAEIERSQHCGCFSCLAVFEPSEIAEWTDEETTALCPKCGIDAVIGDASGFPAVDKVFLTGMNKRWFGGSK
ncbi:cytoplasmic protein [Hyphobacterium sp.]|uniref:cytoplasmic protein n=1 Tax=Hyphobacterium sp. TaxID=2004662 RepID=UPI003749FCB2